MVFTLCFSIFHGSINAANFLYSTNSSKTNTNVESSISTDNEVPSFSFQSEAQILVEPTTGQVLYANNENEKLLPASVTKVMTLLLIMEKIDSGALKYTDTVTCSANASKMGGSQIWFKEGETLTIDEALKAIAVVSANDVTVAMAELLGGSEENFVSQMNKKAAELGMVNTHFVNSHGIDEDNHYTTAKDISIMSMELINKHPDILKYTSIWMDTLRNGTFALSSTNKLIRFYDGATGLKTGSTSKALFNLSATATRKGTTFLAVVMRAPSSDIRLQETKQLLDYGFATYETRKIIEKDVLVGELSLNKCIGKKTNIYIKDDVCTLLKKGEAIETEEKVNYIENLAAPLNASSKVGTIEIYNKSTGTLLGSSDLIIKEDIKKANFVDYLNATFKYYIINKESNTTFNEM